MAISFCGKRLILTQIGEDLPDKDPLLKEDGLPEFNSFTYERSIAAIGKQTVLYEQAIKNIDDNILANKDNLNIVDVVINPLEEINVPIETTWGIAKTLFFGNQSLMPTKYYQSINKRMTQARSTKHTSLPIYNACKEYLSKNNSNLTYEHERLLKKYVLEGRLNGLDITHDKTKRYYESTAYKINTNMKEFNDKVELATKRFKITINNPSIVYDFPEDYLKIISIDKKNYKNGPWKITLEPKIVDKFMEYCPDRDLRYNVWNGNVGRCAMHSENALRNSTTLEDIRDNRHRQAKILGYKSWSHMSMETKVAGNLDNIYNVMDSLLDTARPAQENEFKELTEFSKNHGFNDTIQAWDVDYWSRQHYRKTRNIKDELIQQYFPLPHVLNGLFNLIEKLFNVKIIEGKKTDVWHSDVKFFDVYDLNKSTTIPIAHFYLDPYERTDYKLSLTHENSWMVGLKSKSKYMNTIPLASLIFNFNPPKNNEPSLLTINDVSLLFHKFGNLLQHLLTNVENSEIAGLSSIEWDAVELSGHYMKNFIYESDVLKNISCHYKTNEPLPDDTIRNLINSRSHMAGYKLCKELYFARFDLKLHELDEFWLTIMKRLYKQHFVMPRDKNESFITSWSAIFTGNWSAAYYSNLWSQMMAADAYSAFNEVPNNDDDAKKIISQRFRDTFLSLGGSVHAGEVFRRFRGRDPNSKALLNNLGLKNDNTDI
ncbi:hypothetical protein HCN44_002439 [Aphidius gifuensis]|uniref:Peptidase M3A/M3B catalytic domain-containing protein n=1 Tax=Aphidius gifuensis TaxID=684658 RepID=A0A834Y047_APHGI|nr:hypothetical protein HCN44_002439 [Aphidius gifuensis]